MKPNPPDALDARPDTPLARRLPPAPLPLPGAVGCSADHGPGTSARAPFALKMKVWLLLGFLLLHEAFEESE